MDIHADVSVEVFKAINKKYKGWWAVKSDATGVFQPTKAFHYLRAGNLFSTQEIAEEVCKDQLVKFNGMFQGYVQELEQELAQTSTRQHIDNLRKEIDALEATLEPEGLDYDPMTWMPDLGQRYWLIDKAVCEARNWESEGAELHRRIYRGIYKTREDAQQALDAR